MNDLEFLRAECARRERAQAVVLAAVLAAGGRWCRKTTLWKAFWWAHLESMRERGAELTDYPIVRLPQGPAPNDGDVLVNGLVNAGHLHRDTDENPSHPAEIFHVSNADVAQQWVRQVLTQDEISVVERAARKFKDMTARAASEFSHTFSREWRELSNGKWMSIYRDLLSKEKIDRAQSESADAQRALAEAFKVPQKA